MRFAYADPPYPGQARKHYSKHPDYAGEVDHAALIARLVSEYPDGWALSTSSPALQDVLALCPRGVRVGPWVKPFASFKRGVNPAYAWEPVIFMGGRKRERTEPTVRDWVSCNITLKRGLVGAKPYVFCAWLFYLLGVRPQDTLDDLFPGSNAVTLALDKYRRGLFAPALGVPR